MGEEASPSVGNSVKQIVGALTKYLPQWAETLRSQAPLQAQSELDIAKQYSPQFNELQTQLAEQYLGRNALAASDAQLGADTAGLQKYGGTLAELTRQAERAYNPEYYNTRAATSDKLSQLLGSINLDNANPEAERYIAQANQMAGTSNQPSATSTVANALGFGQAMDNRRNQLSQAISAATQFLPTAQAGGFNAAAQTAGRGNTGTFLGMGNPGSNSYDIGQNLLGAATGSHQAKISADPSRTSVEDMLGNISI